MMENEQQLKLHQGRSQKEDGSQLRHVGTKIAAKDADELQSSAACP